MTAKILVGVVTEIGDKYFRLTPDPPTQDMLKQLYASYYVNAPFSSVKINCSIQTHRIGDYGSIKASIKKIKTYVVWKEN